MRLQPKDYAKVLYALTEEYNGEKLDKALMYFLETLHTRGSLEKIDNILDEYLLHQKRMQEKNLVEITVARDFNESILEKLKSSLKNENIKVESKIDKDMIGGIKIRIGNKFFDGSITNSLQMLKTKLLNSTKN